MIRPVFIGIGVEGCELELVSEPARSEEDVVDGAVLLISRERGFQVVRVLRAAQRDDRLRRQR